MRRFLMAMFVVSLATCEGIDNVAVGINAETTVPQRSVVDELLGPLAFIGFDGFDISQSHEFQNQGYTRDQIDRVTVSSFTLTITSPAAANFDFLQSIAFSASSRGLPDVTFARLDTVPRGVAQLDLQVDQAVDLTPYAVADSMTIRTQARGVRPPQQTTVAARVVLNVDVNVSGSCSQ